MNLLAGLPENFYSQQTTFQKAFHAHGKSLGDSDDLVNELLRLLPNEILLTPSFFLLLTKKWCYEYGELMDRMPKEYVIIGSEQFPEIEDFYIGFRAAKKHLSDVEIQNLVNRLKDPSKHMIALSELAPLVRISEAVNPKYEVEGLGVGNRTIDWLFTLKDSVPILLDVKYRIKDLIQHMEQIIPEIDFGKIEIPPPVNDPSILFKDTVEKFVSRSPQEYLQGVWIHSHIKQDKERLWNYYNSLERDRLHFAIFSRWDGSGYILHRDDIDPKILYNYFNLVFKENFISAT
jgi:hypothetical protein